MASLSLVRFRGRPRPVAGNRIYTSGITAAPVTTRLRHGPFAHSAISEVGRWVCPIGLVERSGNNSPGAAPPPAPHVPADLSRSPRCCPHRSVYRPRQRRPATAAGRQTAPSALTGGRPTPHRSCLARPPSPSPPPGRANATRYPTPRIATGNPERRASPALPNARRGDDLRQTERFPAGGQVSTRDRCAGSPYRPRSRCSGQAPRQRKCRRQWDPRRWDSCDPEVPQRCRLSRVGMRGRTVHGYRPERTTVRPAQLPGFMPANATGGLHGYQRHHVRRDGRGPVAHE